MRVPTKKLLTKDMAIVLIRDVKKARRFKVPLSKVNTWVRTLEAEGVLEVDDGEFIPADDVFKSLDEKYSKPGVAIRGARAKEGLSQAALASRLGIPQGNLSKMENGKRPVGKAMAKRLGKFLLIDYRVFL